MFGVTRVDQFAKSRFPSKEVYGAIDHAGLRLVTCGGTYDTARNRYLDNVIVFAKLEAIRRLTTRHRQPLITSSKGFDDIPESTSTRRSR